MDSNPLQYLQSVSNPFRTKDFLILNQMWREKLAENGFIDQEDSDGNLKNYDRRTQSFDERENISQLVTELGHFLSIGEDIPELHRRILELYVEGTHQTQIVKIVHKSKTTVYLVLRYYKEMILKLMSG